MRTNVDDNLIARLYSDDKLSIRAVARRCGCSPKTVHRRLEKTGVPRRPAASHPPPAPSDRIEFTAVQTAEMISLRDRGWSLDELGGRYECSGDTIGRHLRRHGAEIRRPAAGHAAPPGGRPAAEDLRRLHAQGHTPQQIADELGCDVTEVRAAHHDAGLTPHRGRPMPPQSELTAAYAGDGSVRALAHRYPVREKRLKMALVAAGVTIGPRRVTPADIEEFRRLDGDGVPVAAIARKTGWSRGTVTAHLASTAAPAGADAAV